MGYRPCAARFTDKVVDGVFKPAKNCPHGAVKGSVYCRIHSQAELQKGVKRSPEHMEKLRAGLDRWRAKMQAAKADGLVEVIHAGIFKKGNKASSKKARMLAKAKKGMPVIQGGPGKKTVKNALKILEAEKGALPALPDKPFDQLEDHEKLTALTGLSLNITHQILSLPIDPETPLVFKEQIKLLTSTLTLRVKVDRNMLVAKKQDRLVELIQRLRAENGGGPVLEG